ncbi:MAG: DUF502 domain-containing protein [Gemmataceae bacterium]|nr:DUF502 domain-containing protein [Gemmataceae bacterium]
MRGMYRFLKATILGGLLFLVPLVVLGAIVAWTVDIALKVIAPVFEWLPDKSVGGVSLALACAVLGLVGACFVAGLVAEAAIIRRLGERAERIALFVPGYALMKNVGANLVGVEGKHPVKTVLVRLEASWQLGFLTDTLADGRHVVFVPGVPKAMVGTLHIVAPDRVQLVAISVSAALDDLGRLGIGLRETWPKESVSA